MTCKSEQGFLGSRFKTRSHLRTFSHFPISHDSRKGPRSCNISSFLVIPGDPEITRSVEIIHDRGPFQESLDPPNPRIPPNPHQTIPTKHMISRTGRALRKSRNHQKCPFSQQKCAFPGIPGSSKSQNPSHSWRSPPLLQIETGGSCNSCCTQLQIAGIFQKQ